METRLAAADSARRSDARREICLAPRAGSPVRERSVYAYFDRELLSAERDGPAHACGT